MVDFGDRWMYTVHAVRLLATAKKDNTTMQLATWAQFVVARGERNVIVEDYQVDMHTRRGVALGRDVKHWWTQGALLNNKLSESETPWGKYLTGIYTAGEDAKGGAPE
jgi:hypothetical protein